MKIILKNKNEKKRYGSTFAEYSLALSLLTIVYFAFIIPNSFSEIKMQDTKHAASGVVSMYNDISMSLPINSMLYDPMTITTPDELNLIKAQITAGFDAIPTPIYNEITNKYFKNGINSFGGKVLVIPTRKCLQIQTSIPSSRCVNYVTDLLSKPDVYGVDIGDSAERVLRKSGDTVKNSVNACNSIKSDSSRVTALFCISI